MADGTVKTAVAKFKSWKGYSESNGKAQKYIMKPYNKISGRNLNVKTTPWCQIAVVSCLYQAGLKKYYITAGCKQAMNWYKNKKRWKGKSTKPAVGYQVFYDFKGKGTPTHTGLVVAVSGNTVTVYEGNKSNAVGVRKYNYKTYTKYIVGYGQPYYLAAKAETPATTTPDTSASEPIVTEPITPIPEPAKPVSKPATKPTSKSYRGQVTAKKGLNVRKGPGKNYSKVGALSYNTKVTVFESKNGWGRIGSGKWVSLSYIKKV